MSEGKGNGGGRKPSHRIVIQHDPENDKAQTEVGALWPHKQGGGFGITLKRGISIAQLTGTRINAFPLREGGGGREGGSRGGQD